MTKIEELEKCGLKLGVDGKDKFLIKNLSLPQWEGISMTKLELKQLAKELKEVAKNMKD